MILTVLVPGGVSWGTAMVRTVVTTHPLPGYTTPTARHPAWLLASGAACLSGGYEFTRLLSVTTREPSDMHV